jgi:hypothetical protein
LRNGFARIDDCAAAPFVMTTQQNGSRRFHGSELTDLSATSTRN